MYLLGWNLSCAQVSVSADLIKQLDKQDRVDCMIYLHGQPDLSNVRLIKGKLAKSLFVIEALKSVANKEQKGVIAYFDKNQISYRSFWMVNAIRAELNHQEIEDLQKLETIKSIAYNSPVKSVLPADNSYLSSQRAIEWGIEYIRANEVWNLGFTGAGVTIAGQDTGYEWEHSTLIEKYRGYDTISGNADHNYNWHDAIHNASQNNPCGSNSPFPCDDNNHGTHTMGTMAGDDGGTNQIGVAPGAVWVGCRNMDLGNGTPDTYIECFEWFLEPTDLNGQNPDPSQAPHVINNSWSCPVSEGCDSNNFEAMRLVIENLKAAGIVVVASNGNSGPNCNTASAPPAFYAESFSVGATNSAGDLASFSSRGPSTFDGSLKPDVSAPGVSVRSAIRNNAYATYSGTSMAGPHVAGVVALMISANPNIAGEVELIEEILRETAIPAFNGQTCGGVPGSDHPNNAYGYGIIDAFEAVQAAVGLLPADLIDFYLVRTDGHRHLNWRIDADENELPIRLKRSFDLNKWENIYTTSLSHGLNTQSFIDRDIHFQTVYYRLDWGEPGKDIRYSRIISSGPDDDLFQLFPNPGRDNIQLRISHGSQLHASAEIYNLFGQMISRQSLLFGTSQQAEMNIEHLIPGMYFVHLKEPVSDKSIWIKSFVKR